MPLLVPLRAEVNLTLPAPLLGVMPAKVMLLAPVLGYENGCQNACNNPCTIATSCDYESTCGIAYTSARSRGCESTCNVACTNVQSRGCQSACNVTCTYARVSYLRVPATLPAQMLGQYAGTLSC